MASTTNIYSGLHGGYEDSDCEYQELKNSGRDMENIYATATTPNPALKEANKSTAVTVDKHETSQAGKTTVTVFKQLVAALVIVSCVAVISLMIAVSALVIAVILLTKDQMSSGIVPIATSTINLP